MNVATAKRVVHYAIDKASPFALAQHEKTDTIDKILDFTFGELAITTTGRGMMWAWINAYSSSFEGRPVSPDVARKCNTMGEVWAAVVGAGK